jgi:2-oxo-4-hydroxy-4-carboxy-5-ureidoimidazoline decarboxylase
VKTSLAELNAGDRDAFVAVLGGLFEHSPWVAEAAFDRRPFRDAAHLHAELCAALHRAGPERQLTLIRAHPDLAGRLAGPRIPQTPGGLTAASAAEQASAGLDRLSAEDRAELQRLNEAYRSRFGFPFLLCARGKDPAIIRQALEGRLPNPPAEEHATALGEIEKIAWLRLQDVLADPGKEKEIR